VVRLAELHACLSINQFFSYFGALVGRVANRIAGGRFTISDNTLHGGCDRTAKLNGLINRNGHHLNASAVLA